MTPQEKLNSIYEVINFPYDDGDSVYSPVMIGDVLDYYDFKGTEFTLLEKWKNKRNPLQPEDTELIDYIYNLLL